MVLIGISKSVTKMTMIQELVAGDAQRWPAVAPEDLLYIRLEPQPAYNSG